MRVHASAPAQARTCPSPSTRYLNVHSSRSPIGPRAWSFWVELPISAPIPNSPPSVKRVEAFTYTHAASTPELERARGGRVARDDRLGVPASRSGRCARSPPPTDSTTPTASVGARYSVAQSSSVAASTAGAPCDRRRRAAVACGEAARAARVGIRTQARPRRQRASTRGRNVVRDRLVHEQRLGGVAHARALGLGVQHDRARPARGRRRRPRRRGSCPRRRRSRARSRPPAAPPSAPRRRAG